MCSIENIIFFFSVFKLVFKFIEKIFFFYYCKLHCIEISGLCKITSDISNSNIPNVLFRIVILGPVIGLSYYIDKTAEKNKILAKYLTSVVSQITTVHVHLAFLFKKKKNHVGLC